ncbi:hypothetical protein [Nocardioides sp. NPDC047086]|uniref:hypothetical protein n=1 Tax=Nocardioides sp. NPDC047086 TaxID=3154810 RepID=UPI0033F5CB60
MPSLAAAAALTLTACGGSTDAADGEDRAGYGFVHEDARGKTVEVDGVYGDLPEPPNYLTGHLDVSETKVLGNAWGQFNVEEYAAMNPDLLIDMTVDGTTLWYAGEVEFEDAAARIEAVVKKNPDLTVVAASTYGEEIYFANAPAHPDLAYLAEIGVKFPEVTPDEQGIFEPAGLENISKRHADVLLADARDTGDIEGLRKKYIFKQLPAVAAGQQDLWYLAAPSSYQAYAEVFSGYADQLEAVQALEQG